MGLPFPVFNIPIISSLIDIVNNILETNIVKATIRSIFDISKPYLILVFSSYNYIILYINKLFNTVPVKLTGDLYYIDYVYEGNKYRIVFPIKKFNDINIVKVISPFNDNLEIMKYLGPNNDFHRCKLTPKDIGYKNISITYFKDEELTTITKTFSEDQVLSLN
jgi:hypothetical protein